MNLSSSTETYSERIHQVIDYISEHLSDELTLEDLASVACFSSFHFHRIFTFTTGETPHDFIERLRLEKAANKLCTMPNKSVSDIAAECGYNSISSFSRAFKKYHKISPVGFLKRHIKQYHSPNASNLTANESTAVNFDTVLLTHLPHFHVAYVQTLDGYATGIPKAWEKLMRYAKAHQLITPETVFIGIPYDNPRITPRLKCRYRACITIPEDLILNEPGVKTTNIAKAHYAKYKFRGTAYDITAAYAFLYGQWLPQSGYIPDEKPSLEIYPQKLHEFCDYETVMEYDILLPVHPL